MVSQTGTQTVRQRVQQLRADQTALAAGINKQKDLLNATRSQVNGDAQAYSNLVSAISSRLQAGADPGVRRHALVIDIWRQNT